MENIAISIFSGMFGGAMSVAVAIYFAKKKIKEKRKDVLEGLPGAMEDE